MLSPWLTLSNPMILQTGLLSSWFRVFQRAVQSHCTSKGLVEYLLNFDITVIVHMFHMFPHQILSIFTPNLNCSYISNMRIYVAAIACPIFYHRYLVSYYWYVLIIILIIIIIYYYFDVIINSSIIHNTSINKLFI